jgi:ABC-type Zn uptake system ZnuABC Zn-binding protein ZnuA
MSDPNRKRWRLLAVVGLVDLLPLVFFVGGCASDDPWKDTRGPKVAVSFAPLYCFAANVAGEDAVVKDVMTTAGPHHFNPTDADARLLRKADVLFINGLGLDTEVAATLKRGSGNRKLKVIELGAKIPANQLLAGSQHEREHGHEGHHHDSPYDPHLWLSPDQAIVMVEAVRDELKGIDPDHAAGYEARAAAYVAKLRQLKTDGLKMLANKTDRKIVTFHESLAYFAEAFDLKIVGVVEKRPGVEPTDEEIRELIATCKDKQARLIAVEPQYSSNTSARTIRDRLAKEGIPDPDLVEIDPLETVTADDLTPDWYERKMRQNLDALSQKMK